MKQYKMNSYTKKTNTITKNIEKILFRKIILSRHQK